MHLYLNELLNYFVDILLLLLKHFIYLTVLYYFI